MIVATLTRLGESRSQAPPVLFVQAAVRDEGEGFLVSLALTDAFGRAAGERELRIEGKDCKAVEGLGSLVLAMMIAVARPQAGLPAPAPAAPTTTPLETGASTPVAPPQTHSARAPGASRPPPVSSAAGRPHRLLPGIAGTASLGVLPDIGLGIALRAMYSPRSILLVGLEASFEAGGPVQGAGGEIGFQLFSAAARAGLSALQTERLEIIPIVGLRAGRIQTSSHGLRSLSNDSRTVVLAGLGALFRAKIVQRLFAEALLEVDGVLVRHQFQVRDGEKLYDVHRVGAFAGRLSLGLGYEFR